MMCTKLDRVPSRPFSHVIEVFESFFVGQNEIGIFHRCRIVDQIGTFPINMNMHAKDSTNVYEDDAKCRR